MLRITDRYILREVIAPFGLALLVLTFLLMIPPIMSVAEQLIAKGADSLTILRLMGTLIPQGLGITIPMALLLGVLMGLGRLSADREAVALQACGVSLYRMLYPLAVLGVVASLATFYILAVAVPDANQAFREISFRVVASRAEGDVKPRVFDEEYFPGVVLYVREVSSTGGGWSDVFLADTRDSAQPVVFVAEQGRVVLDQEERRVEVVLRRGTRHQVNPAEPDTYEIEAFDESLIKLDPESVFPTSGPSKGYREMTIPELRQQEAQLEAMGLPSHSPVVERHRKYSIPVACLVFVLIGLGLGVTSRKDGKLASFALGMGVIFAYYILMYGAEAMTKGGSMSPNFAMWVPNIVLGLFGLGLVTWRSTSVERRRGNPVSLATGAASAFPRRLRRKNEYLDGARDRSAVQPAQAPRLVCHPGVSRDGIPLLCRVAWNLLYLDLCRPVGQALQRADDRTRVTQVFLVRHASVHVLTSSRSLPSWPAL